MFESLKEEYKQNYMVEPKLSKIADLEYGVEKNAK